MWRDEPGWWYASDRSLTARFLAPLGCAYGSLAEHRLRRSQPWRAGVPVICIGNFTAGGTGKTPIAILVAQCIASLGRQPVFLTRGYGGSSRGPLQVDATAHSSSLVGDEPLLLARHYPTVVARDRVAGARALMAIAGNSSVIVMDDGLQNPALAKDLCIAVVDGRRGFGNGRCIPAGPMRAPLAFQLGLTGAVIVNRPTEDDPSAKDVATRLKLDFAGPVLTSTIRPSGDVAWIAERPLVAFAGIGAPERFFATLEALGGHLAEGVAFPDHHVFTDADAARLLARAAATGGRLATTEKDHVRLAAGRGPLADLRSAARALPIRAVLQSTDHERLNVLLEQTLRDADRRLGRG